MCAIAGVIDLPVRGCDMQRMLELLKKKQIL